MIKQVNNYLKKILPVLCLFLFLGSATSAAGNIAIVESNTGEEDITVFVKGVEAENALISVQIGTSSCDSFQVQKLAKKEVPVQTLIMIDNSLSIPEKHRGGIMEILQNLISDRLPGEEYAIAVFGEDISYLTDYSSDYTTLKAALDSLTYENKETYLTDVLYETLTNGYIDKPSENFCRIIIISDGVDNKSIGYTKDELYALLREFALPIYTIGCETGKNNEQLENMFAISRMTTAEYFNLEEVEKLLDVNTVLNRDRDILEIKIVPGAEQLDGRKKSVRLTFEGEASISTEIVFPQKEEVDNQKLEVTPVPTPAPTEPPTELEPEPVFLHWIWVVILIPFVLITAAIVAAIVIYRKKFKKKNAFEGISHEEESGKQPFSQLEDTTMLINESGSQDGEGTRMLWGDSMRVYQVILTDIHSPARTFQAPLKHSVIIGRDSGLCNLVVDNDKSISKKHCEIISRGGKFYLMDLQSRNGTCINDCKVLSETEIFSGDIIKMGGLAVKFEVR